MCFKLVLCIGEKGNTKLWYKNITLSCLFTKGGEIVAWEKERESLSGTPRETLGWDTSSKS